MLESEGISVLTERIGPSQPHCLHKKRKKAVAMALSLAQAFCGCTQCGSIRRTCRHALHRNDVVRDEPFTAVDFELFLETLRRRTQDFSGAPPLVGMAGR